MQRGKQATKRIEADESRKQYFGNLNAVKDKVPKKVDIGDTCCMVLLCLVVSVCTGSKLFEALSLHFASGFISA